MKKYIFCFFDGYKIINAETIDRAIGELLEDTAIEDEAIAKLALKGCSTIDDYILVYNSYNYGTGDIVGIYKIDETIYK